MAQQRDLSSEVFADTNERSYAFGIFLSRLFHPILLNIAMFCIVGNYALETQRSGLTWAAICILIQVIPVVIFFSVRMRQGAYSDEDVSVRHQRTELYLFSLGTVVVGTLVLLALGAPKPFLALLAGALVMGASAALINLFWKISVHGASIAGTATVALIYSRNLGLLLWCCAVAVGWARVRTGNHTPSQVLAGFTLAAVVVLGMFHFVA